LAAVRNTSGSGSGEALRPTAADLWAGLAAAAVVLPQAMAFGVALVAPHAVSPATGALAGLIGAAVLSLVSGVVGGTRGLISSPTGPTLVLLAGALSSVVAADAQPAEVLAALAAILIVTGIVQALLGVTGGGRLIKFIPYPVVTGFLTGSGVLMLLSQLTPLSGAGADAAWQGWGWVPIATAAVTFIVMTFAPRVLPAVPGTIAGLLGGTLAFQGIVAIGPGPAPPAWIIGALPGFGSIEVGVSLEMLGALPWAKVLLAGLALAVLASVDTLLTSVIADVSSGSRHDARRELVGQGIGQVICGFIGGMAGAGTTGATVVAVRTGGRRWPGVATGLALAGLILLGGPVTGALPIAALAGIILCVAVGMLERDMIAWLRTPHTRFDAVIALLVTGVTVVYDLMVAVGVGVAIAIGLFIRAQVKAPVVHRRSTAAQMRSVRARAEEERSLLDAHGDRIVVYELRGNLFFATADRVFEELMSDLVRPACVILNLRRVQQVDLTGAKILQQIATRLHAHGGQLMFCEVHSGAGLGHDVGKTLCQLSPGSTDPGVRTFNGTDEALEYAEDALLETLDTDAVEAEDRFEIAELDICDGMDAEAISELQRVLTARTVEEDELVFRQGDPGRELYLVLSGEIDIRFATTRHHHKRLAKYGPGTVFGEVSFIDPGPRVADAVAVRSTELCVLDREHFTQLAKTRPDVAITLLRSLARLQGRHLRWSAGELRRLAEW
jgi:SulP family sulfate permease